MGEHHTTYEKDPVFLLTIALLEIVAFIFYASCADYADAKVDDGEGTVSKYYAMYQDVHVMIFIGFGFLMTFLRKHDFSSLGMTFVIGCLSIQYGIMFVTIFHDVFQGHEVDLTLEIPTLVIGDFAAGATLISFGAVLGRATPVQLCWMVVFEIIFYAINEYIGVVELETVDMGGSMFVHAFGAYFGLAFSFMLGPPSEEETKEEESTYYSDVFAMIGTIFLWMFWPSFNGVLAVENLHQKERVVINTVMALTCSCLATFFWSHALVGKFDMVHIQNATLAGGVAIGSSSDLVVGPWAAFLIGILGGTISTLGYVYLTPKLNKWGIYDVCGIHNLHGMPGILGGVAGAISAASADSEKYGEHITDIFSARDKRSASEQGLFQAAALGFTLLFAIGGGLITGLIVKNLTTRKKNMFSDEDDWLVPDFGAVKWKDIEMSQVKSADAESGARESDI